MASIRRAFTDLPILSQSVWQSVPEVNQALSEQEDGRFASASLIVDAMFRDDRIAGVTGTRINSLLGLPLFFEPSEMAGNSKVAQKIADDLEKLWEAICPRDQLAEMQRWGLYNAAVAAQLVWKDWVPTIQVWHPLYFYWDWSDRFYKIATQDDSIVTLQPGDPRWMVYTPHGYQRGWIRGLVRALAQPWMIRKFTYRDWARYCEIHGMPLRLAKTPIDAKEEHKDRFRRDVSVLSNDMTVRIDTARKDEPSFDLTLLEAQANTYEGFQELIRQAEESISICLLGQNLTTEVKGGSYAAAQVHERVKGDLLRFDAVSLADAIRKQVLVHWVKYNYDAKNYEELTPVVRWQTDPPEDEGAKATTLLALGQSLIAFNAAGFAVDKKQIAEDFGLPLIGSGDGEMDPIVPGKSGDEPDEDDEPDPDADKADDAPEESEKPDDTEKESLTANHKAGWRNGQAYADKVAAGAIANGVKMLQPDVAKVLTVVRASNSPEDLKGRLLEAFGKMDAEPLGRVLQKAAILARLDGRHSVLEDL